MSPYHGRSFYNHGRQQLARDVAEANRIEAAEREAFNDRMRAARQAERDRVRLTHDDVQGATAVRLTGRRGWFRVVRVNTKSVAVEDVDLAGRPEVVRVPFARVLEVRS